MTRILIAAVIGVSTYAALDVAFTECRSRALAATPKTAPLPREPKVETLVGVVESDNDLFFPAFGLEGYNPKRPWEDMPLMWPSADDKKSKLAEVHNMRAVVKVKGFRIHNGSDEYFLVLSVEVVE